MTANELADFIEISNPNDKTHQTIATMLRTIPELEKEIEALKEKAGHWEEKYRDAIADLSIENYWKIGTHEMQLKNKELTKEIEALKNARDYWCLAYKDVFNKLETLKNDSK
jgi:phage host-nuclease inhibitor protein Gam